MICVFSYSNPKYIHKTENKEIRHRTLDCGATDGNPTRKLVVTNQIDENLWIKQ